MFVTKDTRGLDGILRVHGEHKQEENDCFHPIQIGDYTLYTIKHIVKINNENYPTSWLLPAPATYFNALY